MPTSSSDCSFLSHDVFHLWKYSSCDVQYGPELTHQILASSNAENSVFLSLSRQKDEDAFKSSFKIRYLFFLLHIFYPKFIVWNIFNIRVFPFVLLIKIFLKFHWIAQLQCNDTKGLNIVVWFAFFPFHFLLWTLMDQCCIISCILFFLLLMKLLYSTIPEFVIFRLLNFLFQAYFHGCWYRAS